LHHALARRLELLVSTREVESSNPGLPGVEVQSTRFKRWLEVMIGVRGWEYEVSRRLRGMLSLVDPGVKSWRTRDGNSFAYDPKLKLFRLPSTTPLPAIHQSPQATDTELLQARENLMETIQAFLKEYDHIPPEEKCMALLLAEERFFKIKQVMEEEQNQPGVMQELLLKLMDDLQILKGIQQEKKKPAAQSFTPYGNFSMIDDVEVLMKDIYTFLRKFSRIPFRVTPKHLSTIPEKESDEFIKSSVEDLVPIPSESEDTFDNESECDVLVCDDSSPLDVSEDNPVIFSNPLFDSNEDFTSSDDESLSEEDVPKETFKIYSNPLFEFDDDFTSSDVNPLFNEVLEDVESEDSFDSKLAEPTLLISPLSDANKDECFDPGGDEIDAFLDLDISTEIENDFHDSEGDIIFLEKLLINNTFPNLPSEVFLDHDQELKDELNFC
ncbi:hypothetical protein Tco_0679531, partial [Tanacetum coccineum]